MKTLLTIFLVFTFLGLLGQEPIVANIENRPSSQGVHPAFEVLVPQATPDEAIDLLKKTISPGGLFKKNPKVEKVEDEWQIDGVVINDITSRPLDVIAQVSSFPGHIYVRMFFQSNGEFLGAENDTVQITEAAQEFVREYGVDLYRLAVEKELKEEEKELRKLENDLDRLERKNNNFDDKADDARKDQKDFNDETDYQRKDLRQAKRSEEYSEEELDIMEKDLKSAEKDLKKAKKEEAKFERKMDKNEKEQREIKHEIEKQEEKVEQVKQKLENIS
jgi:hypothetical protein